MSNADNDPLMQRAIAELRRMPSADPEAVRRVIGAAAAARVSPADGAAPIEIERGGVRLRRWSVIGIVAAAAVVGFVVRGAQIPATLSLHRSGDVRTMAATTPASAALTAVSAGDPSIVAIPQELVFENSHARRISVVGDFNNWNAATTPMARSSEGRLWSAMIPMLPGRHVYGFMVDDSLFVLDPRAPRTRDPDLGTEASVLMVGRP